MAETKSVIEDDRVALERALGKYEERAAELPASDPRFANALAEEHGVTELRAEDAHDAASDELDKLDAIVARQPEAQRLGLYMAGIGGQIAAAAGEGPAVVRHIASLLESRGFEQFKSARAAAQKEKVGS